jgi:hypothetical protein
MAEPSWRGAVGEVKRKEKMFFFEKKNQKTFPGRFARMCPRPSARSKPRSAFKSFLLLFFKKEALPSLPIPS